MLFHQVKVSGQDYSADPKSDPKDAMLRLKKRASPQSTEVIGGLGWDWLM